ncbi:hypothetical protein V492_03565 [Pseudogymnoascus sp. VKM F-4246]|nr:hypothetical protein V492_03565 [Pseudogymnoascus sp. VKM F-4246]
MSKNAGDEDDPDELPVGLVRLVEDSQVGKAEGDLEAGDASHVKGSPRKVDLPLSAAKVEIDSELTIEYWLRFTAGLSLMSSPRPHLDSTPVRKYTSKLSGELTANAKTTVYNAANLSYSNQRCAKVSPRSERLTAENRITQSSFPMALTITIRTYPRSATTKTINAVSPSTTPKMDGYCDLASTSGLALCTHCIVAREIDKARRRDEDDKKSKSLRS